MYIFRLIKQHTPNNTNKFIEICGCRIINSTKSGNIKKYNFMNILTCYTDMYYFKMYLFHILIFKKINQNWLIYVINEINKTNSQINRLSLDIKYIRIKHQMGISIYNQHSKIFPQFKNLHRGENIYLIATGPTSLYYPHNKQNICIGVNHSFLNKNVILKYWFAIDYEANKNILDELKSEKFIKFFGQCCSAPYDHYYKYRPKNEVYHFPDYIIECMPNAFKFYFDHPSKEINRDIETQALPDLGSCVFPAAYFALYTGCSRLLLVGCDCSANGYFNKQPLSNRFSANLLISSWKIFKRYAEIFYPNVEIISVNPVGLKGMFRDVYTEAFLAEHPEIDRNSVEILNDEGEIK